MKTDDDQIRHKEQTHDVACPRRSEAQVVSPCLSPALRSWIKNCLVPRMVDQYLAERKIKTGVALEDKSVRDSTETTRKPLECNVQ